MEDNQDNGNMGSPLAGYKPINYMMEFGSLSPISTSMDDEDNIDDTRDFLEISNGDVAGEEQYLKDQCDNGEITIAFTDVATATAYDYCVVDDHEEYRDKQFV